MERSTIPAPAMTVNDCQYDSDMAVMAACGAISPLDESLLPYPKTLKETSD